MKRLIYILQFFLVVIFFNSCKKDNGCTDPLSFNYDPSASGNDGQCNSMANCLGYAGGFSNSGTIGNTLYSTFYDQKMNAEVAIQRSFFTGVAANVYILYEPNQNLRNAYATSDGNILFGYHLHYYTIQNYGELPVAGVLAHEWGHRAQQTIKWNDYYKPEHKELEADAFSGYYMALRKQWTWSQIQGYFANVYASGNYLFNSPDFHGTPKQRLDAAYLGVTTGVNALQNNIHYTYNQLHAIFFREIRTVIAPRFSSANQYQEVVYPPNLTEDYIRSLYPKL